MYVGIASLYEADHSPQANEGSDSLHEGGFAW